MLHVALGRGDERKQEAASLSPLRLPLCQPLSLPAPYPSSHPPSLSLPSHLPSSPRIPSSRLTPPPHVSAASVDLGPADHPRPQQRLQQGWRRRTPANQTHRPSRSSSMSWKRFFSYSPSAAYQVALRVLHVCQRHEHVCHHRLHCFHNPRPSLDPHTRPSTLAMLLVSALCVLRPTPTTSRRGRGALLGSQAEAAS